MFNKYSHYNYYSYYNSPVQPRKLRLKKVKWLSQDHRVSGKAGVQTPLFLTLSRVLFLIYHHLYSSKMYFPSWPHKYSVECRSVRLSPFPPGATCQLPLKALVPMPHSGWHSGLTLPSLHQALGPSVMWKEWDHLRLTAGRGRFSQEQKWPDVSNAVWESSGSRDSQVEPWDSGGWCGLRPWPKSLWRPQHVLHTSYTVFTFT